MAEDMPSNNIKNTVKAEPNCIIVIDSSDEETSISTDIDGAGSNGFVKMVRNPFAKLSKNSKSNVMKRNKRKLLAAHRNEVTFNKIYKQSKVVLLPLPLILPLTLENKKNTTTNCIVIQDENTGTENCVKEARELKGKENTKHNNIVNDNEGRTINTKPVENGTGLKESLLKIELVETGIKEKNEIELKEKNTIKEAGELDDNLLATKSTILQTLTIPLRKLKKTPITKECKEESYARQQLENIEKMCLMNSLKNKAMASNTKTTIVATTLTNQNNENMPSTSKVHVIVKAGPARIQQQQSNCISAKPSNKPIEINYEDVFGKICLQHLKGQCEIDNKGCPLSHTLKHSYIVDEILRNLPSTSLKSMYNFMHRNRRLHQKYFKNFCEIYSYKNDRSKLLNMLYDCERYPELSSYLLNVYKALINCGISKEDVCLSILKRLENSKNSFIISEIFIILMNVDWTLFADYLKKFAFSDVQLSFPLYVIDRMYVDARKNPQNTQLQEIVRQVKCKLFRDILGKSL